jgi:hypothetical protein
MSNARKALAMGGSAVRYASRTTGVNFEKLLTWGAIGGVAYLLYGIYSAGSGAKKALNSLGSALGTGLYEIFHPNAVGEMLFYTVEFPDGQRHAVGSRDVDRSGRFTREGRRYQLVVEKGIKTGVNKFAVPVS